MASSRLQKKQGGAVSDCFNNERSRTQSNIVESRSITSSRRVPKPFRKEMTEEAFARLAASSTNLQASCRFPRAVCRYFGSSSFFARPILPPAAAINSEKSLGACFCKLRASGSVSKRRSCKRACGKSESRSEGARLRTVSKSGIDLREATDLYERFRYATENEVTVSDVTDLKNCFKSAGV